MSDKKVTPTIEPVDDGSVDVKFVFNPPGMDAPGYLGRLDKIDTLLDKMNIGIWKPMAEYLLQYVEVPEDRDEAYTLLLQLSRKQFRTLIGSIIGTTGDAEEGAPIVPLAIKHNSAGTLKE